MDNTHNTHDYALPAGMVALDDSCVVRMSCVVCINTNDDNTCDVVLSTGGTLAIDCDIEELLRRISVQNSRDIPAPMGFQGS